MKLKKMVCHIFEELNILIAFNPTACLQIHASEKTTTLPTKEIYLLH